MSKLEITGKYLREKHRFFGDTPADGDTIIAEIHCSDASGDNPPEASGIVTVKGVVVGEMISGLTYHFYGSWRPYKNKRTGRQEQQFSFTSCVGTEPIDRDAVIGYLSTHGAGHGLGKVRATRLWEKLGEDAVRIARTEPTRVVDELRSTGLRFSERNAVALAASLQADHAVERMKLELTTLVTGRGFPRNIVNTLIQAWGNQAPRIVRRDPYRMLQFVGCGFKRCDSMYLDLGLDPARLKRQAYCAWHSIERNSDGHTWFDWRTPDAFLRSNIGAGGARVDRALELAVRGNVLAQRETDIATGPLSPGGRVRWFAEASKARNEISIAEGVAAAVRQPNFWPGREAIDDMQLSDHQREIAAQTLTSSISILGGSPGTGKTWLVSELVQAMAKRVGLGNILVGAPTGKAAVRVTENLAAKKIDLRARTWHSLLMQLERQGERHFGHKVLIGDEASMLDTDLTAAIMRARARGTMLLLVGDVHQLPPVGHGAPLRDMIAAGVAYGELTEIVRNTGGIVEACAAIRDQHPWGPGDNLHLVDTGDDHLAKAAGIYQQARDAGLNPIWDVQVVTAVNEKSALSRKSLNVALQAMLNNQPGVSGIQFRVGDKVVNSQNGFFKSAMTGVGSGDSGINSGDMDTNDRDEIYVANGELAKVLHVERSGMTVELESPRRRVQVYFGEGGCTWELGYALSVHKSQGSDWPWVVVMLDDYPGARMVCDRSWLYTSISRAKDKCWLVGRKATAARMCRVSKIWHRKTFLRELILRERAGELLVAV